MSHSVRDPRVKEEVSGIDEALQEVLTYCRTLMTELTPQVLRRVIFTLRFMGWPSAWAVKP